MSSDSTEVNTIDPQLQDMWKQTKSISWSASTTQEISLVSLDSAEQGHNDIKTLTVEKVGDLLEQILPAVPIYTPIDPVLKRKSIHDWLWNTYITDKIASLRVLRFLVACKKNKAYHFWRVATCITDLLNFCAAKKGVPVSLLSDNEISQSLFDEYLQQNLLLHSEQKILARLYIKFFSVQPELPLAILRQKWVYVAHPLIDQYMEQLKSEGVCDFTIQFGRYSCSRFLNWLHQNMARFNSYEVEQLPLFLVETSEITDFRTYLIKEVRFGQLGEHKASDLFYYVRAWFSFMYQKRLLPKDITLEIKGIPFERYHERELPEDDELQRYFEIVQTYSPTPEIHMAAYSLMLYLGLRLHEVCTLTWNDINLSTKTISIVGKGDQADILPIPANLLHMLNALRQSTGSLKYIMGSKPQSMKDELYTSYKLFSLVTGWKYPGGVHLFRHCLITRLTKMENCPPQLLMQIARHRRPDSTSLYIHRDRELPEAVNKIRYF